MVVFRGHAGRNCRFAGRDWRGFKPSPLQHLRLLIGELRSGAKRRAAKVKLEQRFSQTLRNAPNEGHKQRFASFCVSGLLFADARVSRESQEMC